MAGLLLILAMASASSPDTLYGYDALCDPAQQTYIDDPSKWYSLSTAPSPTQPAESKKTLRSLTVVFCFTIP